MSGTPTYNVDYEDERFKQVETDKQNALTDVNNTYNNMVNQSDQYFDAQIQASKDWADKQQQIQQENTDFAIEQIEQQREQANKDYKKEQSGAYVDWQKQSNQYGANAEAMAANGLQGTGFSESSKVSMYNTYQNRVAVARESYNQATMNFNNAIKEAQLANNSAMAEIAYKAYQQQLELSLQGFQYKNQLLTEQLAQQQATEDRYYSRYQDVLAQLNQENALAEQVRQYNESLAEEQRQYNESMLYQKEQDRIAAEQWQKEYDLQQEQFKQSQINWQKEYDLQQAKLDAQVNYPIIDTENYDLGSGDYEVSTAYYRGDKAENVGGFGYFSNNYQPKGIMDNGKAYELKKSNATYEFTTQTLDGRTETKQQNVWMANGKYYYWEGRDNKYVRLYYNDKTGEFSTTDSAVSGGGGGRSFA